LTRAAAMLDLTPGARLLLDEVEWTVESFAAPYGRVVLGGAGRQMHVTVRTLVNHPCCRPLPGAAATRDTAGQPVGLYDLTEQQRQQVLLRVAHLLEAEPGFRGGDPLRPLPGEPHDGYDPAVTTVEQRRRCKVIELQALGPEQARLLGLHAVSERTLRRGRPATAGSGPSAASMGGWYAAAGSGRRR
jgi:hypothetical protein